MPETLTAMKPSGSVKRMFIDMRAGAVPNKESIAASARALAQRLARLEKSTAPSAAPPK